MYKNLKKETSERSDAQNWAKKMLIENTPYHYDSIEGCNENADNVVTHLMERACVEYDGNECTEAEVSALINQFETPEVLQRKLNFAKSFGLPLSYVFYEYSSRNVWLYKISTMSTCRLVKKFDTFEDFSHWIASVKGWDSGKGYRESEDLPEFDKALRRAGTAWPTNIDCFVSNEQNEPIGIIEFLNVNKTKVKNHDNNDYYLCKIRYSDDIRRWHSQEILRVQSGLRLFIITWSSYSTDNDFKLREIEKVTLPYTDNLNKAQVDSYKDLLNRYINNKKNIPVVNEIMKLIENNYSTFDLEWKNGAMCKNIHRAPLARGMNQFPYLYFNYDMFIQNDKSKLPQMFMDLMQNRR